MKGVQIKETLSFRHGLHGNTRINIHFLPPCFPRNPCLKYKNAYHPFTVGAARPYSCFTKL